MNTTMPELNPKSFAEDFDFGDELTALHMYHLIGKHSPVILEIGANCGQSTVTFIEQMPSATVYCFEPDPRAISKFKRLIQHPNVHLIEAAVGANSGHVMFHQSSGAEHIDPAGWDHSGSIRKPKTHLDAFPGVKFEKQIPVPLIKLDDWTQKHQIGNVDFIWADVQGAESDLILGAIDTLLKTRYFYTEYSDDEQYEGQINFSNLSLLLNRVGFDILHKYKHDVLFHNINPILI
jgi:FkbM family methyltransferase